MRPPTFLTDIIKKALPHALRAGVSYSDFWELDFSELQNILGTQQEREEQEVKERLNTAHVQALFDALAQNGKLKPVYEYFPELFAEEYNRATTAKIKAMFAGYASSKGLNLVQGGDSK